MKKVKKVSVKNGKVDEENGHVEYEIGSDEGYKKVKLSEVTQTITRMNRAWMESGCQNMKIMEEEQSLMSNFQSYNSLSKSAVLKSIERTVKLASAGGNRLKPIAEAANNLLSEAHKICGNGISDKQMREHLTALQVKYPKTDATKAEKQER